MKMTKGHEKMLLYLNRLIRTEEFKDVLKEYAEASEEMNQQEALSKDLQEQRCAEILSILKGYEALRKRCLKLFQGKAHIIEREIAENYFLDYPLLRYAMSILEKNETVLNHFEDRVDMCRVADLEDEEITPLNEGEEIIHLQIAKQQRLISYPKVIQIHAKASKEDIIDFISKRWLEIDESRLDKGDRLRKGKVPWKVLDFIWEHRDLPARTIGKMLKDELPSYPTGYTYNEINDIIRAEKRKRTGNLSE